MSTEPSAAATQHFPPAAPAGKTPVWGLGQMICRPLAAALFDLRFSGVSNVPRTGGVLLLSNHQSFLDPVMLALPLPRPMSFLAKAELFDVPVFGWLIRQLNAFPVRRGEGDVAAVRQAIRRLREGHVLTIFPEGTRTRDGEIGPIQPGVAMIVRRAGVPVVPAVIDGAHIAWPRGQRWPAPARVRVVYGRPLLLEGTNAPQTVELIGRTLREMLQRLRGGEYAELR